jgi:hypothetical protein
LIQRETIRHEVEEFIHRCLDGEGIVKHTRQKQPR